MSDIHERLRQRKLTEGSVPKLTDEQVTAIRAAFAANPAWADVYLFYDGHVVGGDNFRKSLSSPLAGIVSMATDGIPACISRTNSQIEELK